jgi:thioredoxin-like negative regulator of GroEL
VSNARPAPVHSSLLVLPYRALLRRGAVEERQRMVMDLYQSRRGESQAVLRQALSDPDERIRLLAAQALERLSETARRRTQELRAAVQRRPTDPALKLALARHLVQRADDEGTPDAGHALYDEAAQPLLAALPALKGRDLDAAHALLGHIYTRQRRTAEARAFLERVPADAPDYVRARINVAQTRLADGDIAGARVEMRRVRQLAGNGPLSAAGAFWESAL